MSLSDPRRPRRAVRDRGSRWSSMRWSAALAGVWGQPGPVGGERGHGGWCGRAGRSTYQPQPLPTVRFRPLT